MKRMTFFILLAALLMTFSDAVFAHGHGHRGGHHHGDEEDHDTDRNDHDDHEMSEPDTVKSFADLAHHEMESPTFLNSINPRDIFLRALRFYNKKSADPEFGEHAKNLALLLPISESLELATGPLVTQYTLTHDLPLVVEGLMNVVGWAISTPLVFEPYCMTVLAVYTAAKPVQRGMTRFRLFVSSKAQQVCDITGLSAKLEKHFVVTPIFESLLNSDWVIAADEENPKQFWLEKEISENSSIQLKVNEQDDSQYVSEIKMTGVSRKVLKRELKILNWGARQLLLQSYKGLNYSDEFSAKEILLKPTRSYCEAGLSN